MCLEETNCFSFHTKFPAIKAQFEIMSLGQADATG